jgi:hypothetical protein
MPLKEGKASIDEDEAVLVRAASKMMAASRALR